MRLNLHTHSYYSDGVFAPEEVVKMQADENIEAMSLTDHDSISGIDEAVAAGEKLGLRVLPGIELSSYSNFEIHILGYNFDYKNPSFQQKLDDIKELRRIRIGKTVERLKELNVKLDTSALDFENENLGRVHIARLMVKQGFAASVSEAFYYYLGAGKKAHIAGYRLRPFEAVRFIKDFGGVAVLAHPVYIQKDKLELLISGLAAYGLDGIECYYSSHNETDTKRFLDLAAKYRLIVTNGTDMHDSNLYISPCYVNDKADGKSLKKLNLI